MFGLRKIARTALLVLLIGVSSCADDEGAGDATSQRPADGETPVPTIPAPSPTLTATASDTSAPVGRPTLELRTDGLGDLAFGDPMWVVLAHLVELLGTPMDDVRLHGDMPMGWGDVDTTVRLVDFGGLRVVFDDWEGYFRDDGKMHLVAWSADDRRASNGIVLATPEGIAVGARVPDLQDAFGPSLHLPAVDQPGCAGPPWYFAVAPEEPWGLVGSLSAPPADAVARVQGMGAGAKDEGWIPCWEP